MSDAKATYLERIVARHREMAAADTRPLEALRERAQAMPRCRGFRDALASSPRLSVIAEIKRRSPSKGELNVGLDPVALARAYARGGADCLSVLTDAEFFGGSAGDLAAARGACHLPVLRKDFTVGERDVYDARIMGADCVLLIVAALSADQLVELHHLSRQLGMDALVEVHDEAELAVALRARADLVGVNQRDLVTFEVDHERAVRMAAQMPLGVVRVAESGVRGPDDARVLFEAGYHAVLVGESLVTSGNPAQAVAELLASC